MAESGLIAATVIGLLNGGGYLGLILLMGLESACIPIPSELILPFAGFLASKGEMNLWLVALAGAVGCNLGSIVAYEIGRYGGRAAILRWGRYVLLTPEDLAWADAFFLRFGAPAVLIGRMLPVIRTFIALPAGIARMPRVKFHVYTFVGSFPWCLALAYVGLVLGDKWNSSPILKEVFHYLDYAVVAVALILLVRFVTARRKAAR